MAFILIPKHGEEIMINTWNWRPTLQLLRDANVIDDDLYERMGTFGREARVDADTAGRIAVFSDPVPESRILRATHSSPSLA